MVLPTPRPIAPHTCPGFAPACRHCLPFSRRPNVPAPRACDYAIVRVVPHVDREEFINAGVILFCDALDFLEARIELDESRLLALSPDVDLALLRRLLDAIPRVCQGGAALGPIGAMIPRERWHWLVAPRS